MAGKAERVAPTGTRDIAMAALHRIDTHEAVCEERTKATHDIIEKLERAVAKLMLGALVAACTLAGDLLIRALH